MDGILQKSDLVLVLISFCLPVTPFLLTGMPNDGYAMYVWRSGYDPSREKKFSLPGIFIYLFRDFFHVKFEVGYIIFGRNKL
jgi:hypothetical protein